MDDAARADDIAALARTVRRCTAVLVVAVGVHLVAVTPGGSDWGLALVVLAGFYLFASVTYPRDTATGDDRPDEAGDADVRSESGG